MNEGTTRGKGISFTWQNEGGIIKIDSEKMQHQYTHQEVINALGWLNVRFKANAFPLANNVETLYRETEKDGLGKALYSVKKETSFAQGASYLGVVLEQLGIFELISSRPIEWRLTEPYVEDVHAVLNKLSSGD